MFLNKDMAIYNPVQQKLVQNKYGFICQKINLCFFMYWYLAYQKNSLTTVLASHYEGFFNAKLIL